MTDTEAPAVVAEAAPAKAVEPAVEKEMGIITSNDLPKDTACLICESKKSTGRHYDGAAACEACKKFFMRETIKGATLKCKHGLMSCEITVETRNSCKYCRYQKCLTSGMNPKKVQNASKPIRLPFQENTTLANTLATAADVLNELKEKPVNPEEISREHDVLKEKEANENHEKLITELKQSNSNLQTKNTALANALATTADELNELKEKALKLEQDLENANQLLEAPNQLVEASNQLVLEEDNIRVFARVRPPLESENGKERCQFTFFYEVSMEISKNELQAASRSRPSTHTFGFDHVFDPDTTQEEIFDMVSPLIQSALDGYNVCIFSYGQTGSGKTFTMEGVGGNLGIIPRTVKLLFDSINSAATMGWNYKITASFLEIYNEKLYDLLSNEGKAMEIHQLKPNSNEIYVSNIEQKEVGDASTLYELMRIASSNRATASTLGNERSSRSHAVTRLEVVGRHASRDETIVSFINLIDLAGSESAKTSQRIEETKNINRSLSELSNVILALVQKNEHVPYRNSKLTYLLMPSLDGNCKILMFVNISPLQDNFVESVKSLRFASQVNECKITKARRNRKC